MKKCSKCGIEKPLSEFFKDKAKKDLLRSCCKICDAKNNKNWQLNNRYKISLKTFEEIKDSQNNKCAICEESLSLKNQINVDHCHETGKVRGILCSACNFGLGQFKDSVERLKSAIEYISHHETKDSQINS